MMTSGAATPTLCVALTREIGDAAGSEQLIGGQMEDLLAEKKADVTAADLEYIHHQKIDVMLFQFQSFFYRFNFFIFKFFNNL